MTEEPQPPEQKPLSEMTLEEITAWKLNMIKKDTKQIASISEKLDEALTPNTDSPSPLDDLPEQIKAMAEAMTEMQKTLLSVVESQSLLRSENIYLLTLLEQHLGITPPSDEGPMPPEPEPPTKH